MQTAFTGNIPVTQLHLSFIIKLTFIFKVNALSSKNAVARMAPFLSKKCRFINGRCDCKGKQKRMKRWKHAQKIQGIPSLSAFQKTRKAACMVNIALAWVIKWRWHKLSVNFCAKKSSVMKFDSVFRGKCNWQVSLLHLEAIRLVVVLNSPFWSMLHVHFLKHGMQNEALCTIAEIV